MPLKLKLKSGETISLVEKVAVVDYETEWSDEFSISNMSYYGYTRDPRFRAYLVSIVTNDGFEWVGDPKDAPWHEIHDHVWVSFNTPFDKSVYEASQERGITPAFKPKYWGDAMTVCAYIRSPRSLAKAMSALYGIKVNKKIRDVESKGRTWEQYGLDLQTRLKEYALNDGRHTLRLWMDHIHMIPSKEIRIADLIAQRGLRGVYIDREGAVKDMQVLKQVLFTAEQNIPWRDTGVILSKEHLASACREHHIEPPPSLDMKDDDCAAWEDKYGDRFPWVAAMRDWRRMNALLKKYEMIVSRIKPDGRAEFSIKYMGTHTGRTSAGEKGYETDRKTFNMLNLPRSPFYVRHDYSVVHKKADVKRIESFMKQNGGKLPDDVVVKIDLRSKIIPGPGMKFAICDLAQIEARITNWFARDTKTLDLVRSGLSVYDVHAINMMGYVPPNPPQLDADGNVLTLKKLAPGTYSLAKARELALGYQSGHVMFITMAPTYVSDEEAEAIFSAPITEADEKWYLQTLLKGRQKDLYAAYPKLDRKTQVARVNAQIQVQDFRSKRPALAGKNGLWRRLHEELRRSVGGNHLVELPSGRILHYFDVVAEGSSEIKARTERGGPFSYFYGGKILANSVSATARDIFVEGQLKLDEAGIDTVLDIYDENVCEVPLDFDCKRIAEIMTTNPEWAKTLPLGAEMEESLYYKK
jgi:hypothetical protein